MEEKACKNCRLVVKHTDTCPLCGSKDLTDKIGGYVIVLNSEKSTIAKKLSLKMNSVYALDIKG
ncbi:MAG TPA: transcription elongation factor subunit Spt4 [Candidatus Acidoferrum sp.]|nr:transcription elongation factor subunit Spt4 [Candidatus Acidoferrum sp.]